ncbi:hypothetical protein Tco_0272754 [Tanacetum coccineum]
MQRWDNTQHCGVSNLVMFEGVLWSVLFGRFDISSVSVVGCWDYLKEGRGFMGIVGVFDGYVYGVLSGFWRVVCLESKVMREYCFVVVRDAWLRDLIGKLTLSSLDVLQGFSFFLQIGFTLILATLNGLDVGLLGDVIGEDDCNDDG